MAEPLILTGPTPRRRGRPPGSGNRRSLDLARYIEATFAGQTPGQQAAAVSMVTPGELKRAKRLALELGIVDVELSPLMLAMVVKAAQLASAIGCTRTEAWALMARERTELMGYVHQKLPTKADPGDPKALPTVFLIPGDAPPGVQQQADEGEQAAIEFIGEIPPRQA